MAPMGRSRVRRSLTALLVATVVAVSASAALSAVQARGTDDLPETFQVRTPHVGDRGVYEVTLHGGWLYGDFSEGEPFEFLRFEWGEDSRVRGGDGLLHDVNVLRLEGPAYFLMAYHAEFSGPEQTDQRHWYEGNGTWSFAAGSPDLIARGEERQDDLDRQSQSELMGVPFRTSEGDGKDSSRYTYYGGPGVCFLRTPLQDASIRTRDAVDMPPCMLQGLEGPVAREPMTLRAVAVETVAGLEAVRFDGPAGMSVWYHEGISAPLRMVMPASASWDPFGRTGGAIPGDHAVFDLVSFEPGEVPVSSGPDDPDSPLPDLVLGDRMPWGMDDSGVDHPFPASQAFQAARADPDTGLQEYLSDHPDAVLVSQHLQVVHWQQQDAYVWLMGVSDGETILGVRVQLSIDRTDRLLLGADLPLSEDFRATIKAERHSFPEALAMHALPFDPATFPGEIPTAESALARWMAAMDRTELPDAPYYTVVPDCDEGTCGYRYVVGVHTSESGSDGGYASALVGSDWWHTWDYSQLSLDSEGDLLHLTEVLVDSSTTESIATPGGVEPEPRPAGQDAPRLSAGIIIPVDREEAAVVGAAALLSAVLYWAWPFLKTTPLFGLFSRLRTPELLEHPNRRAIQDAVTASPGIHFKRLQRETGLANGTLRHHLRHLVEGGLVAQRSGGRYTCYFPAGRVDARAMTATSLLKSDGSRAVMKAVEGRPGITAREVAHATGLSPGTVAYHIDRLAGCGAVVKDRDGRQVRLHVSAWAAPTLGMA